MSVADGPTSEGNPGNLLGPALKRWADSLVDVTGRNQLLFCKPAGKQSLDRADAVAVAKLLNGQKVMLSRLFPTEGGLEAAAKTVNRIRQRIRAYDQDRGIRVGRLTDGFATWDDGPDRTPRAPVLLRHILISQPVPGIDDYQLRAEPDIEVNPVLLHVLSGQVTPAPAVLEQVVDLAADNPAAALAALERAFSAVRGFRTTPGRLLGTFQYARLPMVDDLTDHGDMFGQSDLVAALAGQQDAVGRVRGTGTPVDRALPNRTPPADEYLVLDADPSQNYAINAALAGHNLVVQGPPGTGKSQTIANLIATATARGKRVLFVAEKRAAIDAVLRRLADNELASSVLDLHDGATDRSRITSDIRDALAAASTATDPQLGDLHDRLVAARSTLTTATDALHAARQPLGLSVADMQITLLGLGPQTTPKRFTEADLATLDLAAVQRIRQLLADAAANRAFAGPADRGPWHTATTVTTDGHAVYAADTARAALQQVTALAVMVHGLADSVRLRRPTTLDGCVRFAATLRDVHAARQVWTDDALTSDLSSLIAATGDRAYRKANHVTAGWGERRRALKATRQLRRDAAGDRDRLHHDLQHLRDALTRWRDTSIEPTNPPQQVAVEGVAAATATAKASLDAVTAVTAQPPLHDQPLDQIVGWLQALTGDLAGLNRTRRVNSAVAALPGPGIAVLPDVAHTAAARPLDQHPRVAVGVFDQVLFSSALDRVTLTDTVLGGFDATHHDNVAREFATIDRHHLDTTAARIRRRVAEHVIEQRSCHPGQDQILDKELPRKRRIASIRDLVRHAPEIIFAAKPCWMMSPLAVSQVLPATAGMFDIVVFDEASQIRPAEAIPALARAKSAVVAGDSQQLPPSTFFDKAVAADDDDEDNDAEATAYTEGMESLLDSMNAVLGATLAHEYYLSWHYRSEDARLIGFSNKWFYRDRLLTFPGTRVEPPVRLEHVAQDPTAGGDQSQSVTAEVDRVIDLAIEHATNRPDESLGIIAAGIKHAKRINEALQRRLRTDPDAIAVRDFFGEGGDEEFFVKNLERVQGDERDAIILTTGYGKNTDGRTMYWFGPINEAGGERRLNVAVTRAKKRLTVVSSFTADDLDPARLNSTGAKRLRAYLQYAQSGGTDFGDDAPAPNRPMNPFEINVHDRLTAAGLSLIPQYGVSGYYLDFAVRHPTQPGRMILAIETDGATYHSAETARARDRLRQEHLEKLGWRFHRIWSRAWFTDPTTETQRALRAYQEALQAAGQSSAPTRSQTPRPAAPGAPAPPTRSGDCPVLPGLSIKEYSDWQLLQLMEWIASDTLLRTTDEMVGEAVQTLGYRRRGHVIAERLATAARRQQAAADKRVGRGPGAQAS